MDRVNETVTSEGAALRKWAEQICFQVKNKWSSARNQYPEHDHLLAAGWAVFYSPIQLHPDLMIIGRNPGGGKDDFIEECFPAEHEYLTQNYPLARQMKGLFDSMKLDGLLRKSVKLNLLFFRSRSIKPKEPEDQFAWSNLPLKLRQELETFCEDRVLEIIHELRPRIILAEGIETYGKLKQLLVKGRYFKDLGDDFEQQLNRRTVYARKKTTSLNLIGILHLSGAHPSGVELDGIRRLLATDLTEVPEAGKLQV